MQWPPSARRSLWYTRDHVHLQLDEQLSSGAADPAVIESLVARLEELTMATELSEARLGCKVGAGAADVRTRARVSQPGQSMASDVARDSSGTTSPDVSTSALPATLDTASTGRAPGPSAEGCAGANKKATSEGARNSDRSIDYVLEGPVARDAVAAARAWNSSGAADHARA